MLRSSFRHLAISCAAALSVLTASSPAARAADVVNIASVLSVPSVANFWADKKGYFRDAGIEVKIEAIDSLSKAMSLLATNQLQLAQGGINAGFFNAVAQGLPVTLALESGSTPVHHNFVVRADLKDTIKTPRDLKGRNVAVSGVGSLSVYELAAVMESAGLSLADVNVKPIGFPQMAPALAGKALDVALMVAPFTESAIQQGLAVAWLDPEEGAIKALPMTSLAYLASADWIRNNRDIARRVVQALVRAGRDYCQAYHHGPQRDEMLDMMVANGIGKDRAQLNGMDWQARNPDGAANPASLADIARLYRKEGFLDNPPAPEKLVDGDLAASAAHALGPFKLINEASPLGGCR